MILGVLGWDPSYYSLSRTPEVTWMKHSLPRLVTLVPSSAMHWGFISSPSVSLRDPVPGPLVFMLLPTGVERVLASRWNDSKHGKLNSLCPCTCLLQRLSCLFTGLAFAAPLEVTWGGLSPITGCFFF